MKLTAQQFKAIRRHRRERADADAEARFQQDVVGPIMGFADVAFVPPSVQVGWMEPGRLGGGFVVCLQCAPCYPTASHTPVYQQSVFARELCAACGRRLDSIPNV
jgi:hypothetical protein